MGAAGQEPEQRTEQQVDQRVDQAAIQARGGRYYGWTIVAALAITETISWGILYYAFSVFMTPMEAELGWSRTELTGGFSLALLVMGALAYPVGSWIDRRGGRALMTCGSIAASLLVIAWSQVSDVTAFYAIWAGLGVCAAAVLYEPAFAIVAVWFHRQRTKALAIITFAAGLASTIFLPLSDWLLTSVGWRDAVLALGVLLAVTTIPLHALVLRRRPSDLGLAPDGDTTIQQAARRAVVSRSVSDALHSRFFWLIIAAFSVSGLASGAVRVHFIPLLIGSGVDPSTAALASGSIGIMQVVGRFLFAPLEARSSSRVMSVVVFAVQTLALAALLSGTAGWQAGAFIVLFGMSIGAITLARAAIVGDVFGYSHYGRISSIMAMFFMLANTVAPVGAGALYDSAGSYQPVLIIAVVLAVIATGMMALARPDGVKRAGSDVEVEAATGS